MKNRLYRILGSSTLLIAFLLVSAEGQTQDRNGTAFGYHRLKRMGSSLRSGFSGRIHRWKLEHRTREILDAIPNRELNSKFVKTYLAEFIDGYLEHFDGPVLPPDQVLVANKRRRRVHLYVTSRTDQVAPPRVEKVRSYKVAIGKHAGTHNRTKGLNPEEMITPEGIFWVDDLVEDPVKKYRNGPSLGPRVVSLQAPGRRSPFDDMALHGSPPNAQWTVGKARTFGCLRMYNDEVIDLYDLLAATPGRGIGTLVVITP